MSSKPVSYTFDTLPPLTEAQQVRLAALNAQSDDGIDLTEIPELTEAQLAEMRPAAHYRPIKQQITARIDADVLDWLKGQGKGYQTRINAILREAMMRAIHPKP